MGSTAFFVQSVAGQGFAAAGNSEAANFLIVVTDPITGAAVTNLIKKNFQIVDHFSLPGATCGFSGNITAFNNVLNGAYHIQVKPQSCKWVKGDYLAQIMVSATGKQGQTVATLSIK